MPDNQTTPAPDATAFDVARDYGAAWLTEKHVYDLVAEIERLRHSRSVIYEKYCDLLVQLGGIDA